MMVTLSDQEISLLLSSFFWPFCRISGFFLVEPFFSSRALSRRLRIALALPLTFLIAPLLPAMPEAPVISVEGVLVIVYQLLIGMAMGMVIRVMFMSVEMAGVFMSMQMGLSFAMSFDPQLGAQVPAVSRFLSALVFLLFLAFDGHLLLISVLIDSFRVLPISLDPLSAVSYRELVMWGGRMFAIGFLLASPVVGTLLVVNIAIGVMTRAAPQFNIFTFGFPLTISIGLIALYFSMPAFLPLMKELYETGARDMLELLKTIPTPPPPTSPTPAPSPSPTN